MTGREEWRTKAKKVCLVVPCSKSHSVNPSKKKRREKGKGRREKVNKESGERNLKLSSLCSLLLQSITNYGYFSTSEHK